MLGDLIAT